MAELNDLSVTDASNTARFPEGQSPASLNNAARALEGIIARANKDANCTVTASGTNTYAATVNADNGFALYDGFVVGIDFTNANTSKTVTLNLTPDGGSALTAKTVVLADGASLPTVGQVAGFHWMVYDGTNFRLMNPNFKQPAFLAYNSTTDANVTGDGSGVKVNFDTEVFDTSSALTSDTFTAPVTGKYLLCATVQVGGIDTSTADIFRLRIITSNRTYENVTLTTTNDLHAQMSGSMSVVADMDAADTAFVQISVTGMGSATADVIGDGANLVTHFSGVLVSL